MLGMAIALGFVALGPGRFVNRRAGCWPRTTGPIEAVALHYTLESSRFTNPCYEAFLKAIGTDRGCHRGLRQRRRTLARLRMRSGSGASPIRAASHARDRQTNHRLVQGQVSGRRGVPATLVCPIPEEMGLATRAHDAEVAGFLGKTYPTRFANAQLHLKFDAGDILATGSHIIVSDSLWHKNNEPTDFVRRLERMFCAEGDLAKGCAGPSHRNVCRSIAGQAHRRRRPRTRAQALVEARR